MADALSIEANATAPEGALAPDAVSTNPNANIALTGKVDASAIGTPPNPALAGKPAHVPEKFWRDGKVDYDGLIKSYTELEKRFTASPTAQPTAAPTATPTASPTVAPTAAPTASPDAPSSAIDAFTAEYESTGKLSEESYKKLETEFKLPREVVDAYVTGQAAARAIYADELIESVGGTDKYVEMCKAAKASWTPQQIAEFSKEVEGVNPGKIKSAVERLANWYNTEFGGAGNLIQGETGVVADGGFKSNDDILNAMRDPKYASSESFRKEVERKTEIYLRRIGKIR